MTVTSEVRERCQQQSPRQTFTEPTCKRDAGHEPPHRFRSHGGLTDLEQFPTAKELGR
jgi:hypothetical protein